MPLGPLAFPFAFPFVLVLAVAESAAVIAARLVGADACAGPVAGLCSSTRLMAIAAAMSGSRRSEKKETEAQRNREGDEGKYRLGGVVKQTG